MSTTRPGQETPAHSRKPEIKGCLVEPYPEALPADPPGTIEIIVSTRAPGANRLLRAMPGKRQSLGYASGDSQIFHGIPRAKTAEVIKLIEGVLAADGDAHVLLVLGEQGYDVVADSAQGRATLQRMREGTIEGIVFATSGGER